MSIIRTVVLLAFCCVALISHAQQRDFNIKYRADTVYFNYMWQDAMRKEHSLQFSLPKSVIQRGDREFALLDETASRKYVLESMQAYARDYGKEKLVVRPTLTQDIEVEYRGTSDAENKQFLENLEIVYTKAVDAYLFNSFYTRYEGNSIMPDHARIVGRYTKAVRPIAQQMAYKVNTWQQRDQLNYVLNFLQAIPYDELQNRYTSNGAGFQTPYGLLFNNKGDCDTKSVAYAALLRNFFPDMKTVLIYLPGHMLIGLATDVHQGDKTLEHEGITYVLAEPAGPGILPVGKIGENSMTHINNAPMKIVSVGYL